MPKKSITPRRLPSQKRSKEKVEAIRGAAVRLLERSGVEDVTAIKIAEEAGISVASVYQYFPNKNAVIYSLYQQWLREVNEKFDRVEKNIYRQVPIFEFLKQISNELVGSSSFSEKAEIELFRAMEIYPHLQQLDTLHGQEIADRLARYIKEYGSKWSMSRLKNLGWFIYLTANAIFRGGIDKKNDLRKQFREWSDIVLASLLDECMR
ncbi:MAG: TetR/AcrR family transcriptional regulator [Proteobacteria bacterium]|nr:TetR/AcrR family transcriptional regulator [Pseudomonadota bacterium]